jgi:hypothetical protein
MDTAAKAAAVPALPRNLEVKIVDATFSLPPGLAEVWLKLGYLRPVWFVSHGMIVRGVRVEDVRALVNHRRCWHVSRAKQILRKSA